MSVNPAEDKASLYLFELSAPIIRYKNILVYAYIYSLYSPVRVHMYRYQT